MTIGKIVENIQTGNYEIVDKFLFDNLNVELNIADQITRTICKVTCLHYEHGTISYPAMLNIVRKIIIASDSNHLTIECIELKIDSSGK